MAKHMHFEKIASWLERPEESWEFACQPAHAAALHDIRRMSECSQQLQQYSDDVLPMLRSLAIKPKAGIFSWFFGAELEHRVATLLAEQMLSENLELGRQAASGLMALMNELNRTELLLVEEIAELSDLISAAERFEAIPDRLSSQMAEDPAKNRLNRLRGNLEAYLVTCQLSLAQVRLAVSHAQSVLDRQREIELLLLPLWGQQREFSTFISSTGRQYG